MTTPIWDEVAAELELPEFGVEPLPLPTVVPDEGVTGDGGLSEDRPGVAG